MQAGKKRNRYDMSAGQAYAAGMRASVVLLPGQRKRTQPTSMCEGSQAAGHGMMQRSTQRRAVVRNNTAQL